MIFSFPIAAARASVAKAINCSDRPLCCFDGHWNGNLPTPVIISGLHFFQFGHGRSSARSKGCQFLGGDLGRQGVTRQCHGQNRNCLLVRSNHTNCRQIFLDTLDRRLSFLSEAPTVEKQFRSVWETLTDRMGRFLPASHQPPGGQDYESQRAVASGIQGTLFCSRTHPPEFQRSAISVPHWMFVCPQQKIPDVCFALRESALQFPDERWVRFHQQLLC